jgi:beta-phosphoglucomutase-like phosphatase (HAD superfamily)
LNPAIDLVIFDCDGVLVDSEVISCRAHAETLTRHGSDHARAGARAFSGRLRIAKRATIETEICRKLPDDFEAQMKQAALRALRGRSANHSPYRRGDRRDRSAQMRGIERHARQDSPWPHLRRPL